MEDATDSYDNELYYEEYYGEDHKEIEKLLHHLNIKILTDTGKDSKLVHRQKRPKVDTLFSSLFSDAFERRV